MIMPYLIYRPQNAGVCEAVLARFVIYGLFLFPLLLDFILPDTTMGSLMAQAEQQFMANRLTAN